MNSRPPERKHSPPPELGDKGQAVSAVGMLIFCESLIYMRLQGPSLAVVPTGSILDSALFPACANQPDWTSGIFWSRHPQ
jgi:hypothetical protein